MCTIFATTDQTINQKQIEQALMPTTSRGPDAMRIEKNGSWLDRVPTISDHGSSPRRNAAVQLESLQNRMQW